MSELAGQMATLKAEHEAKEQQQQEQQQQAAQPQVGLLSNTLLAIRESPTDKAEERQQRLWTTLAELGIRPKSVASNASEQELL